MELFLEAAEKQGILEKIWKNIKQYGWDVPKDFIVKKFNQYYMMSPEALEKEISKLESQINKLGAKKFTSKGAVSVANIKKLRKLEAQLKDKKKELSKIKKGGLKAVNWKNVLITVVIVAVLAAAAIYIYKKYYKSESLDFDIYDIYEADMYNDVQDFDLFMEAMELFEAKGKDEKVDKQSILSKIWEFIKKYGWDVPKSFVIEKFNQIYKTYDKEGVAALLKEKRKLQKEIRNVSSTLKGTDKARRLEKLNQDLEKIEKSITKLKNKPLWNKKAIIITAIVILVVAAAAVYYFKFYRKKAESISLTISPEDFAILSETLDVKVNIG